MSKELIERNSEIYIQYKQGETVQSLSDKYGLSRARIYQIIDYVRQEMYMPALEIPEIKEACRLCDSYDNVYRRIVNCLKSAGLHKRNAWKHASRTELLNVHGLGTNLVDIVLMAQTITNRR